MNLSMFFREVYKLPLPLLPSDTRMFMKNQIEEKLLGLYFIFHPKRKKCVNFTYFLTDFVKFQ